MREQNSAVTLAGDIGGTKSLFGIFDGTRCIKQRRLANTDFFNFAEVLAAALAEWGGYRVARACLAVAGPIADDGRSAKITNLPWWVDAPALEAQFDLPRLTLVNDFAAAAMGAVKSESTQRVTLQEGRALTSAPQLVVGAGTGLGMAVVLPQDKRWQILPGEGGHIAFAPADDEQVLLWQALHAEFGRVTWERVVSGPGLEFIYRFICEIDGKKPVLGIESFADAPLDSSAGRAVALFLRCYGAYAGDMSMAVLPRGGVHLAGGVATKLLPQLRQGGFIEAFNAKVEHAQIAAQMPIHVCTDPALGLRGAALLAASEH
jgi:glucokinase